MDEWSLNAMDGQRRSFAGGDNMYSMSAVNMQDIQPMVGITSYYFFRVATKFHQQNSRIIKGPFCDFQGCSNWVQLMSN